MLEKTLLLTEFSEILLSISFSSLSLLPQEHRGGAGCSERSQETTLSHINEDYGTTTAIPMPSV